MIIFPAIDIIGGKAVRLTKGDYNSVTIYSDDPVSVSEQFKAAGATHIHIVDLEGAKYGNTPNFQTVIDIKNKSGMFCEIGGGIRDMDTVEKYLNAGIDRVILGTIAVTDPEFVADCVKRFSARIAVGADIRDGYLSIKGWTEASEIDVDSFFKQMSKMGVDCIICTDISKDGVLNGTNIALYADLAAKYNIHITASGGVTSIDDIKKLRSLDLYGAIIGKAYYTGMIDLKQAVEEAK